MDRRYTQLGLKERKLIQEGLGRGDSFRAIARLIGAQRLDGLPRSAREPAHAGLQAEEGCLP